MNIIDVSIILIILLFGVIGLKRGLIKETISFLGFFLVIVLSFILKNPLSKIMYSYLPFFKFSGILKGTAFINILFYEIISFFIILSLLSIVLKLLVFASSIFEKLLRATIILSPPSKILGFIIGLIEGITWSFIILYIVSLPIINIKELKDSKIKKEVLKNTPILSNLTNDTINSIDEVNDLIEEYKTSKKIIDKKFDLESLDILLKYKIVSIDSMKELQNRNKIKINIDELIEKYEEK